MPDDTTAAVNAGTTPAEGTAPEATTGEKKQEKTFTQAELDAIVTRRLSQEKKDLPSEEELTAYRKWKDDQKTAQQKADAVRIKLETEKTAAENKATALERQVEAHKKGIPADRIDHYAKLAESYMSDKTDFAAALDLALKDFPVSAQGVPGSAGNPPAPPKEPEPKNLTDRIALKTKQLWKG